jgi:hypothetical protein
LREVKSSEFKTGERGFIVSWKNWPSWDQSFVTKDQIDPESEHVYIFKYKQAKLQKLPLPKRPLFMRDRKLDKSELSSIEGISPFLLISLKIFQKMSVYTNRFVAIFKNLCMVMSILSRKTKASQFTETSNN